MTKQPTNLIRMLGSSILKLCLFLMVLFSTLGVSAQVTKRMYFIGNSVTDGMNYDGVKAMAESRGYTHIWARHMIPGSPLFLLWEARANPDQGGFYEQPYGNEVNAFTNYDWDAITLQPFDRAIYDPYNPDQGDSINCANYANLAVPRNPNVQFYIYGRYPRTPNDVAPTSPTLTADSWNALHLGNFTDIYDGSVETRMYYEKLTQACTNSGITNKPFLILPVGEVMLSLNNKMKAGQVPGYTKIWQLYSDGIHMNNVGSFLVGTTFFSTIYKESPVGLPVPSQYGTISSSLANIIQQTVWEVVSTYQYAGIAGSSNVAVSSVSLSNNSTTVSVGQNFQLTATVSPSNATNQSLTWTSSNNSVATVNSTGRITGVAAGSAVITATSNNGKTATCNVTVSSSAIAVTGVSVSPANLSVKVGNTSTLAATISPSNATNQNVSWSSSNTAVATVDATGKVTAVSAGTATITVRTTDGNKTATSSVTSLANAAPVAVISATPISGNAPLVVAFNSSNSYDPDNGDFILGYEWDFGDGSAIDKSTAPSHTFTSAGTYTVKLKVMDNNNLFGAQTSQTITVSGTTSGSNIATSGTGAIWQDIPAATSTSNASKLNVAAVNNQVTTVDVNFTDVTAANNWQAAGVTWTTAQSGITSVKFYNGFTANIVQDNGVFLANFKLQSSTDGTAWTDVSGWSASPAYPYSVAASNQVYTFTGAALNNVKGIRVIGQLRLSPNENSSWAARTKEVEVFAASTSVAVTGVSVSPTSATVNVGATTSLTATVAPSNATNKNVSWSSSNTSVATVSSTGVVTGVAAGSATITVTTQDGAKTATSAITVNSPSSSGNIATAGTGAIWQDIPAATSTSNASKLNVAAVNNQVTTVDVNFTDVTAVNNWQAAGVTWATAQSGITSVKFYNGFTANIVQDNGVFSANFKLQSSTDGTTWTDVSGWSASPAYPYSVAASNQVYTFTGTTLNNVRGIRIVGQLRTASNEYSTSWAARTKEVEVFAGSTSVAVTGVSVSPTSAAVNVGATTSLTATVAPSNATNKNVSWSSSNTSVATVSSTGVVTGVAAGSATITVTTQDGAKTATSAITVNTTSVAVTGVSISPTSASVNVGATTSLTATVAPSNATNKNVTWSSSNTSVATVSSTGVVTGVAAGSATITVTTQDGAKTATSAITVTTAPTGETNIAIGGAGTIWQEIPAATPTADVTKSAVAAINNNDLVAEYKIADAVNADSWQAAGLTWATAQNSITSVKFYNGYTTNIATENGVFLNNFKLQSSTNGTTWTDVTTWSPSPAYPYNEQASNQVYTFTGPALNNIRGLRVIGQVRLSPLQNLSWAVHVREVQVITSAVVNVSSISVNPTTTSLAVGEVKTITPTILPSNATNKNITWTSSNSSIVSVSSTGQINGVSSGTAVVTATTQDGNKTATTNVTVTAPVGGIAISVNSTVKNQTIDGFGFFGPMHTWWDSNDPNYFYSNAWLDYILTDLGITIWRDEYFPPTIQAGSPEAAVVPSNLWNQDADWNKQKATVQALKAKSDSYGVNLKFIFTVWSPPAAFKCKYDSNINRLSGQLHDGGAKYGGALDPAKYTDFANWLKVGIKNYKDIGIDLYAFSPANEPYFTQGFNSCFYKPEWYTQMLKACIPAVKATYPNVKVYGSENMLDMEGASNNFPWFYHQAIKDDPTASNLIDILAVHGYSDGVAASSGSNLQNYWTNHKEQFTKPLNKAAWMTETSGYIDAWESNGATPGAFALASDILAGLTYGDMKGWVYWYGSAGDLMNVTTPLKPYFACKQFYRYIRPGAVRVNASSGDPAIAVGAFENPSLGTNTVVLINTATTTKVITLNGFSGNFEMFASTATDNCASKGIVNASSSITLPARSVVTLISGGTPLSNIAGTNSATQDKLINNVTEESFSVYPNPANDLVTIALKNDKASKIELYSINGAKVLEAKSTGKNTKLDVSKLNSGLYLIKVTSGNEVLMNKLIKK